MKNLIVALTFLFAGIANASDVVGVAEAKGVFFKDKIKVVAFDDPDIQGVTCYTTYYDRSLSLSDSSSTSISCRKTGKISGTLAARANVFSQNKNWFFKKTVVQRFYDAKRNVLIYLTYTTATEGSNASHSISVVVVE